MIINRIRNILDKTKSKKIATSHSTPPSASTYAHPFQFTKDKSKTDREDGDDSGIRPNFSSRKWDNKWTGRGSK